MIEKPANAVATRVRRPRLRRRDGMPAMASAARPTRAASTSTSTSPDAMPALAFAVRPYASEMYISVRNSFAGTCIGVFR